MCNLGKALVEVYRNLPFFGSQNFRVTLFLDVHHRPKIFLVRNFSATCARVQCTQRWCVYLCAYNLCKYPHRNISH